MKLIGTPDCWFYTRTPPMLLGGSDSKAVSITPYSILAEALDFPPKVL
jgi:hypothetical protein